MASDIVSMPSWETQCPCCRMKLLIRWQMAYSSDGGESAQFCGLEAVDSPAEISQEPVYVQLLNPRTNRYVKLDKTQGRIVSHKKTPGPYKNIHIIESKED